MGGGTEPGRAVTRFQPQSQDDLAPSGARARVRANFEVLRVLRQLDEESRTASTDEQQVLARWSGWGAVPQIFDESNQEWLPEREHLKNVLDEAAYAAARRTTINAHYTDPAYVRAMWNMLTELGFDEGQVLEPGCGSGTFIGMAPSAAAMTGVELDPTTARVAQALYPAATIRAESFAATRFPDGYFDATIGNVPFADVALHDARHNRSGHRLHNHVIIKSLELTRPGGIVAVLTSRYTLDQQNPAARREMNELADLLGAVRLPTGAHRRAAGTEVVTDLLVFRRREPGTQPASTLWETVTARRINDVTIRVNSIFDHYPERVLGNLEVGHGMYGDETLHVRADNLSHVADQLQDALQGVTDEAQRNGRLFTPRAAVAPHSAAPAALAPEGLWDGHLVANDDGETFSVVQNGVVEPQPVPATQRAELRTLLHLRDTARALLTAEASTTEDTDEINQLRSELRDTYSSYVSRWGPVNRYRLRATGRTDPETGETKMARQRPPVMRIFRADPFSALVHGLELFDDQTQTATPASLMSERVVVPRRPVLGVDTPEDALAVVLDTHGRVDLGEIARLLGQSEVEARQALGEQVYDDPESGELVTAAEYLSGNVRTKLEAAEAAAAEDPAYRVNVAALRAVQPAPLGLDEIEARMGAAWIDTDTHRAFLNELLDDPTVRVDHPGSTIWEVRGNTWSVAATSEWGTERMPAPAIAKAVLEQRPITVTDEVDGKRIVNADESAAAAEKASLMQERFAEWVWEDPQRADRLAAEYNRRFNSIVLRDYTREADRLALPGLARSFTPRAHQRVAVARMISEPAVGLFHEVGAGKTAEMVMGTMELKRLGLVTKPAVIVPNHMLEQFSREWLGWYPQARILAASSEDLAGEKRRQFVARAATNDWDAIVMTRGAFHRIPVSTTTQQEYMSRETDALRAMLERSRGGEGLAVKRLEKMVMAAEERMAALLDTPDDPGITWEATGIDYLAVDELHDYKNLSTPSNIRDAAIDGSKRATDLHMKLESLRERHGHRVVTGATATPIANSITEAHVMQRYLRPDLLEAAGVLDFDAWAATFGQTLTEIEMGPTGNYRMQTRFARFQNVPEMLKVWHVFADVKTAEDLQLPAPQLRERDDGKRQPATVVVEPSDEMLQYVQNLGDRAEQVRSRAVESTEDNMLKISTDGRKAALDMRLVGVQPAGGPTKLEIAAENIHRIWREHQHDEYLDPQNGQPATVRGALQIVFCDLSTPGPKWNAYDELRRQLTRRGMPREQIRFIHEAERDADKAALFAAARAGHVAVLMGSTQKMGVGTNVQTRAVALHHLDCPWRPADIAQREGRIVRQGNQHDEVGIYRYVVEGSFDAYSWQTVERKARFIAQVMRGRLDLREIEDIGDQALSAAEVKALASGDPLVLAHAEAQADVTRLERLARAHRQQLQVVNRRLGEARAELQQLDTDLPRVRLAADSTTPTTGESFAMTVDGHTYRSRTDAASAIQRWVTPVLDRARQSPNEAQLGTLGTLGGHDIRVSLRRAQLGQPSQSERRTVVLSLPRAPRAELTVTVDTVTAGNIGLVRQLENRVASLGQLADELEQRRMTLVADCAEAEAAAARPFKHAEALSDARAKLAEIRAEMHDASTEAAAPAEDEELKDVKSTLAAITPRPDEQLPAASLAVDRPKSPTTKQEELER